MRTVLFVARPMATRRMITSGLMHCKGPVSLQSSTAGRREGGTTYHDLAEHREDEVLHVAVARVRDDEDQSDDRVRRGGLEEHRGDGDVGAAVLAADGPARLDAHVEQARDEQQGEQHVERDRDREVRQRELDSDGRPKARVRAGGLKECED